MAQGAKQQPFPSIAFRAKHCHLRIGLADWALISGHAWARRLNRTRQTLRLWLQQNAREKRLPIRRRAWLVDPALQYLNNLVVRQVFQSRGFFRQFRRTMVPDDRS
jgi:transposase